MNIILCSEKEKIGDYFAFERRDERYIHIIKVLKLKVGDFFKAGIISGKIGEAKIKEISQERIVFSFEPSILPLPLHPLHLLLGIPRPIQLKRILKDVSTIGISSIHLVGTVLGEKSYLTSSLIANDELTKHLLEGAVQAGSTLLPSHRIYSSLNEALKENSNLVSSDVVRLLFDVKDVQDEALDAKKDDMLSLDSLLLKGKQIVLAVGSERGWERTERELFGKYKFTSITLGHRIMKSETAVIAALSYVLTKINWDSMIIRKRMN